VRLLAGVAHFRAPAATRERAPGRDAAHLQHGNGNAAGGPVKEIQESPDRAGAGRGKGVYGGPDCERRAEGDVHVIFCLPRRPRDTEKTLEPRICHRVLRGSVSQWEMKLIASANPPVPSRRGLSSTSPALDTFWPWLHTSDRPHCGMKSALRAPSAVQRCRPLRQNPS